METEEERQKQLTEDGCSPEHRGKASRQPAWQAEASLVLCQR